MSTLPEFLLARIAEDEAVARAAVGDYRSEAWHLGDYDETVLCFQPSSPEKIAWNLEHFGPERAAEHERWGGFTTDPETAPHIARHDPARVLAECEAKGRIVEGCAAVLRESRTSATEQARTNAQATLELLALPFADHPDYREEWRP